MGGILFTPLYYSIPKINLCKVNSVEKKQAAMGKSPASNFVGELSSCNHCSQRSYRGGLRILSGDSSLALARRAASKQLGQVQQSASSSLM